MSAQDLLILDVSVCKIHMCMCICVYIYILQYTTYIYIYISLCVHCRTPQTYVYQNGMWWSSFYPPPFTSNHLDTIATKLLHQNGTPVAKLVKTKFAMISTSDYMWETRLNQRKQQTRLQGTCQWKFPHLDTLGSCQCGFLSLSSVLQFPLDHCFLSILPTLAVLGIWPTMMGMKPSCDYKTVRHMNDKFIDTSVLITSNNIIEQCIASYRFHSTEMWDCSRMLELCQFSGCLSPSFLLRHPFQTHLVHLRPEHKSQRTKASDRRRVTNRGPGRRAASQVEGARRLCWCLS